MNLNNFERYIDKTIVDRGRTYYREGRVNSLTEGDDNRYTVAVTGSDRYTVSVELDESGTIQDITCDCPYTGGPHCKHMAAVLFALSQGNRRQSAGDSRGGKPRQASSIAAPKNLPQRLAEQLSVQPQKRLVDLLLTLAAEDAAVGDWLRAELAERSDEKEKWIRLMRQSIEKAMDRDGFINYRNCQYAVEGAYKVLERVRSAVGNGERELAVDLSLQVMQDMVDMLQYADDSDGEIGMVAEEAFHLLAAAADSMPEDAGAACFRKVLAASMDERYDGWPDWRMNLLQISSAFVSNSRQREQLENCLDELLQGLECAQREQDAWTSRYETESILVVRYGMIQRFDGPEQAVQFLYEYRRFPGLREAAIQQLLAAGNFAGAEKLALEGEKKDKEYQGLVHKWKQYRFNIYQRQGGKREKLLAVGRELAVTGDFAEYLQLKALYPGEEWSSIYPDLLADMTKQSGYIDDKYTKILKEERDWPRLWEYVQKNPQRIVDFYRQLLPNYREQVYELFTGFIRQSAARSDKRPHYKQVCSHIRLLAKIGGRQQAIGLIGQLTAEYRRRPAFCEELLLAQKRLG